MDLNEKKKNLNNSMQQKGYSGIDINIYTAPIKQVHTLIYGNQV